MSNKKQEYQFLFLRILTVADSKIISLHCVKNHKIKHIKFISDIKKDLKIKKAISHSSNSLRTVTISNVNQIFFNVPKRIRLQKLIFKRANLEKFVKLSRYITNHLMILRVEHSKSVKVFFDALKYFPKLRGFEFYSEYDDLTIDAKLIRRLSQIEILKLSICHIEYLAVPTSNKNKIKILSLYTKEPYLFLKFFNIENTLCSLYVNEVDLKVLHKISKLETNIKKLNIEVYDCNPVIYHLEKFQTLISLTLFSKEYKKNKDLIRLVSEKLNTLKSLKTLDITNFHENIFSKIEIASLQELKLEGRFLNKKNRFGIFLRKNLGIKIITLKYREIINQRDLLISMMKLKQFKTLRIFYFDDEKNWNPMNFLKYCLNAKMVDHLILYYLVYYSNEDNLKLKEFLENFKANEIELFIPSEIYDEFISGSKLSKKIWVKKIHEYKHILAQANTYFR